MKVYKQNNQNWRGLFAFGCYFILVGDREKHFFLIKLRMTMQKTILDILYPRELNFKQSVT